MGNIIKMLRMNKGMTQEELGDYLGVKKSAIQKYESGAIVNLKVDTIKKLSQLFQVAPSIFIFSNDEDHLFKNKIAAPKHYSGITNKWLTSNYFGNVLINSLELNEQGLQKVDAYIQDLCKINEYKDVNDNE